MCNGARLDAVSFYVDIVQSLYSNYTFVVKLTGMNIQSRDEALRDFREDSSVRVLLMSLKAGGVALNLTVANEAYLLDREYIALCFCFCKNNC